MLCGWSHFSARVRRCIGLVFLLCYGITATSASPSAVGCVLTHRFLSAPVASPCIVRRCAACWESEPLSSQCPGGVSGDFGRRRASVDALGYMPYDPIMSEATAADWGLVRGRHMKNIAFRGLMLIVACVTVAATIGGAAPAYAGPPTNAEWISYRLKIRAAEARGDFLTAENVSRELLFHCRTALPDTHPDTTVVAAAVREYCEASMNRRGVGLQQYVFLAAKRGSESIP